MVRIECEIQYRYAILIRRSILILRSPPLTLTITGRGRRRLVVFNDTVLYSMILQRTCSISSRSSAFGVRRISNASDIDESRERGSSAAWRERGRGVAGETRESVSVSASQWPAEFETEFVAGLLDFSSLPATCVFGVESALTSHS